jgi:aconitase A
LNEYVDEDIEKNEIVCCGVIYGKSNFEGSINKNNRDNYID